MIRPSVKFGNYPELSKGLDLKPVISPNRRGVTLLGEPWGAYSLAPGPDFGQWRRLMANRARTMAPALRLFGETGYNESLASGTCSRAVGCRTERG